MELDSFNFLDPARASKARKIREQARIRQNYQRIRDVAKKEMTDLTKLAELLPDKQYDQLFSVEVEEFKQLLKILLTVVSTKFCEIFDNSPKHGRDISETRRISMLKLLDWLLWEIGEWHNAMTLAEDSYQTLTKAGLSEYFENVIGIKAILSEADKECDTTVYKKRFLFPNIAQKMKREGKMGFESGRP